MPRLPKLTQGQANNPELVAARDKALGTLLNTIANELEERLKSGALAAEFKGMRTTQLTFQLKLLSEAFKGAPSVNVGVVLPSPPPPEVLHASSAMRLTDTERENLRIKMAKRIKVEKEPKVQRPQENA